MFFVENVLNKSSQKIIHNATNLSLLNLFFGKRW